VLIHAAAGRSPVTLSTHPLAPSTHYQQLVVDFPRSLRVSSGDVVSVSMSCTPAQGCTADLDLSLGIEFQGVTASAQYRVDHRA
jgi:type I protein arginine methyltransferase